MTNTTSIKAFRKNSRRNFHDGDGGEDLVIKMYCNPDIRWLCQRIVNESGGKIVFIEDDYSLPSGNIVFELMSGKRIEKHFYFPNGN
jgi:hypothetical protein